MDTPTYDMYEDDDEGAYSQVPDIDDVSPDTYNCYVGTEVELSIRDKVMSGKIKVAEYSVNVIAENMYTQCNAE
jgi:hypothetical protein